MLLSLNFLSPFLYGQTSSGIGLSWNGQAGCQLFGDIRNGTKDPVLIDNIVDGQCITVCRESIITYTLSGNLGANPITSWTVTGGTIVSQTNTTCIVTWSGLGTGQLTFTTSSDPSIKGVTKTLCFDKVELPKAQFTIAPFTSVAPNLLGCSYQTIYFTNLSTTNGGSGLYSYVWEFGDGTTSAAFSPSHIYTTDGIFLIKLTVTNSCGCSDIYTQEIKIGIKGFDISCPSVVCGGQTVQYSLPPNAVTYCNNHYNWSVVGGHLTDLGNGSASVVWDNVDTSGFGSVTFDPSGCNLSCASPTTIRVPIIQSVGTITGHNTTCLGGQERYVLPQWPATTFNWSIVGNTTGSLAQVILTDQRNEIIIQPHVSGNLVLRCTYQNTLLHCGGVAEFTIHVINSLTISGPDAMCQNNIGNYTVTTGESTWWNLTNSAGIVISSVASSATFSYNFTTTGNYTLTIGGLTGCSDNSKTITVVAVPTTPSVIAGATVVCPNAPYTYSVSGSGMFVWQIAGGTFIGPNTGASVVVQFDNSATHTLSVYRQTQTPTICNSAIVSLNITNQAINADISAANDTLCANTNATYNAIQAGSSLTYSDGDTYTWSITDPTLGSITTGQGTNSISVLWNNVTTITTATLQLAIKKCSITQVFTKAITIKPVATIAITTTVNSICSGSPIAFTLVSTNGVVLDPASLVVWNYGNGVSTPSTAGLSSTYTFSNISLTNIGFNVTASISNPNGCIGTAITPIKVITVLPAPNAAISLSSGVTAFCPPQIISTVLTATFGTGATIKWYKQGSSTVLGTGNSLAINNTASMGYGSYYIIATNAAGCATTSNSISIYQFCAGICTVSPTPILTNSSAIGCITPTTTLNCNCGLINLVGTASGAPTAQWWDILGPNPANSFYGYTGTSIGSATAPLEPGDYNIYKKASYVCTNGQSSVQGLLKRVIVPYRADFSYSLQCNGSNYNITLIDTSPFYAPVANRTFKYYTSPTGSSWTLVSSTQNYTLLNQPAGNYYIKLVIQGTLSGAAQTPCEKIILVTIAANTAQTIKVFNSPISCHDTAVQFGVNNYTLTDTYLWDFGDGATSTLQAPSRVFSTSGAQTVTLQITNKYGCLKPLLTYSLTIPAKCFGGNVVSNPNPASVCAGSSATLSYAPAADNCPVSSYQWMNGNTPVVGGTTPTLQVNSTGFYWVRVTSANNCTYEVPTRITPIINPIPELTIGAIGTQYCSNSAVPISITTNAPNISWSVDGVVYPAFSNQTSVVIPAGLAAGTHTVAVTATSAAGCSKTATRSFSINQAPAMPTLSLALISCSPYVVKITASGTSGTYSWSNGDSGHNYTFVSDGGPYEVLVSSGNCSVRAQIMVPKNPEDYIWIFPTGCFTACTNTVGTLIGPRVLSTANYAWLLNHNPLATGSSAVPPQDLTQSGVYNLSLNTGFCTTQSNNLNYTVTECKNCLINVVITSVQSNGLPFCSNTVNFTLTNSSGAPLSIVVSSPTNQVIASPSSFLAATGSNAFSVNLTPINGFMGGTITLLLQGTNLKDNSICTTMVTLTLPACTPTGKMQQGQPDGTTDNSLVIAPNPTNGLTTIHFATTTASQIELYSLLGVKMAETTTTNAEGNWEVDTALFAKGVYVVVLRNTEGIVLQQKLIVE